MTTQDFNDDIKHDSGATLVPMDDDGGLSLDELADGIRNAFVKCVKAREDWIAGTLELAGLLHEARSRFPSNEAFSDWLARNGLGKDRLSHQDRAALINIGEHIDIARGILEKTDRSSWRMVWDKEIKKAVQEEVGVGVTSAGKTEDAEEPAGDEPEIIPPDKNKELEKLQQRLGEFIQDWHFDFNQWLRTKPELSQEDRNHLAYNLQTIADVMAQLAMKFYGSPEDDLAQVKLNEDIREEERKEAEVILAPLMEAQKMKEQNPKRKRGRPVGSKNKSSLNGKEAAH